MQDLFGDGAGFGGEFPGAAEVERAAAIVAPSFDGRLSFAGAEQVWVFDGWRV